MYEPSTQELAKDRSGAFARSEKEDVRDLFVNYSDLLESYSRR